MAALYASMAVKCALDNLISLLPATPTSTPFAAAARIRGLEDLRMLEPTMRRIYAALDGAEQHWNLHEESTQLRLKELKDLAYDAEDVVEEYEYEVSRCRVEAFERSAAVLQGSQEVPDEHYSIEAGIVPVPSELALRARKVIERFTEIQDYYDTFSLSENDGERRIVPDIRSVRQTSSIIYAPRILGRGKDKEKVIEELMSRSCQGSGVGSSPISVLPIIGMGGLGKTTLAQLVYNDTRVSQSFDLRAWVCVSEHFDVENITRKIITSLTGSNCRHIQACDLQGAFADQVKEKRILLVLDDVWNERSDYWELLCMPMLASRRCDIIVTTRSKEVARLMQTMPFYNLKCLSPDQSWSLFKQTAFVEQAEVTPANLVVIGRSITKKCKGLPLAIKTLGSILRYETNENKWRDILESELWDLKQSRNEVLPALELSYKYMPVHLKRCFVSLSLYPKNIYLDENRVVLLWKILHLLQCDGSDNMDEIGSLYYNELVQRSLLEYYIDEERVMHDLVHDLACFLAGDEFFRLDGDNPIEIPRDVRYLSLVPDREKSIQISNASQSLRAIIMIGDIVFENPEALFLNCRKFRIIHIEQVSVAKALLDFMGGMKLLRHFKLYDPEQLVLPDSFFQLFNLHTLNFGAHMVHGTGRLVNLHTLPEMYLSKCDCFFNIRELRNMNKMRELRMNGLCNVSIRDANEAHLHNKRNLEILELNFKSYERKSCRMHTERSDGNQAIVPVCGVQLLESLRPHHQSLKVLMLKHFNFDIYPSWLGSSSFSKLTELLLHSSPSQHCPMLGELPSLKSLKICGMEHVKHIGREFCSLDPRVKGFGSLKQLIFEDMPRLSDWSGVKDGEFPCLETISIWNAFELRYLPLVPFLSLRSFILYDCRSLVTFPASATLRELRISACGSLNELPALPSLQSMSLSHCPSLVTLVGDFPLLERLSIWSHTLMSIHLEPQSLPSLTELEIHGRNLQYCDELGSLTSLKKLDVSGSPRFHVPDSLRSHLEELIDL